jgi:hypothetical protein
MQYKLGKTPARHAIRLQFADVFDASKLPKPPAVFGHSGEVDAFHMLGNDKAGCCVWAGAAHEHMLWTSTWGRKRSRFLTKNVLSDYSAVTGFDPAKPDTDNGTDMKDAASYRRKTGIVDATGKRHTIDAYAALQVGNVDQAILAMYLMGAAGIGFQFPDQAMDQFDAHQPWTVPAKPKINGGHYVSGVGRNAAGNFLVVTWGRVQEMTPAFYERFCDEAVAYISLEILNDKNLSPEGFDANTLRKQLASL